ncbi:DinB family protein [Flavobacterium sp. AG291]|uniref:DinB family protein n=1 Tax=Flavobacterium sp. AG291 TaxID=2184000 RepID=UPI000E0CB857|nr:DinB family protein [Flavobacterium sp. AG291]RDI13230.1 DinB family protein [Flavobacterium sp. AG291]
MLNRLQYLINTIPDKLRTIPDADFSNKPAPEKWSKKEIIGHLIDSATNNHHRFVRAQFEDVPKITYAQNNWNNASCYQDMDKEHVISFWANYNQHLIEVVKRIPEADMLRECNNGGENNITLQWLIADYVVHMEHHLRQAGIDLE